MSTARLRHRTLTLILYTLLQYPLYGGAGNLQHHMSRKPPKTKSKDSNGVFFKVTNQCPTSIYPGVTTQSGRGADTSGFELKHNEDRLLQVSSDWQGRLWGRTNCSFNDAGTSPANGAQGIACQTGDCNGLLQCMVTVSMKHFHPAF